MTPFSPFLSLPFIVSMLLALSFHEWAHGFVAYRLGDPTAKYAGRLTLNPAAHLDLMGTLMFLLVGFGWGKPVPVDPRYFRHWKRDTALVALAGPLSNLVLACAGVLILYTLSRTGQNGEFIGQFGITLVSVNLSLMAFNLLPIAPLDGSKIVQIFVPLHLENEYEQYLRYGPYILLALLVAERVMNMSLLSHWITFIVAPILNLFERLLS